MDLQALFDGMGARWQRERAESQMTLGALIATLEQMPPDAMVDGLRRPHSYRGYYEDLAFERAEWVTARTALAMCRLAIGRVFEGYKGGDYMMDLLTPLWIADYGRTGTRIMGLDPATGVIATADEEAQP